jgi:hypothetical protein
MTTKNTKWPNDRSNAHKMHKHLPLQDPRKFTQIGIFGLATLTTSGPFFSEEPLNLCKNL